MAGGRGGIVNEAKNGCASYPPIDIFNPPFFFILMDSSQKGQQDKFFRSKRFIPVNTLRNQVNALLICFNTLCGLSSVL